MHTTALSARSRARAVAPSLRIPDRAAASVFTAVRQRGAIARDVVAQVSTLSIATVNRQVTALRRSHHRRPEVSA